MQNPEVEKAWDSVQFPFITAITAEEMSHLPGHRSTAELYGPEEGYAVLLEVFHQIHCLVSHGLGLLRQYLTFLCSDKTTRIPFARGISRWTTTRTLQGLEHGMVTTIIALAICSR